MQVQLEVHAGSGVRSLVTWSPSREDTLGFALADSGMALALSVPAPELASRAAVLRRQYG
jgi:hypothetical protein